MEVLRIRTHNRFPLSPLAIGLGVVIPPDSTLMMFLGAAFFWLANRRYGAAPDSTGYKLWVDAQQESLDAITNAQILARDLLIARQHRFHATDLDDRAAALHALDGAGYEEFLAIEEVVEHLLLGRIAKRDVLEANLSAQERRRQGGRP